MVGGGESPPAEFGMRGQPFARGMSPGATLLAFEGSKLSEIIGAFVEQTNHFKVSNHSYTPGFPNTSWISNYNGTIYSYWPGNFTISTNENYKW